MVIGEWIALSGVFLGLVSGIVAGGKTLLENSVENSKKLTHIASSVDSTCEDLIEIKDSMKELRSEQKIHAVRVEAMERQAREDRYLDQQRHDELRAKVKDLWKIFKESHPELFKRQSDFREDE
jgi:hypothetical protein